MDWKAQLASSIEAAFEFERSISAIVEESAEETAMRHKRLLRIKRVEDMARRDPVWAEKIARRHAAFRDAPPSTAAPAMATSTSPAPALVLPACVGNNGDLAARPLTTCSTNCPDRASASSVSALISSATPTSPTTSGIVVPEQCYFDIEPAAVTSTSSVPASIVSGDTSMVIGEAPVTAACTARDTCVYPEAQLVAMPIHVPVAGAPRALTPATTKPASSAALDFGSSAALATMSAQFDTHVGADTAVTDEDEQSLAGSSVERTLALVTARVVVDDYSFVTGAPAVPLTLSVLGIHDGSITNKHKVTLPLKLMQIPMLETKEQSMSPAADLVPHHCAPGTARMVFPYASVALPREVAWSRLFDVLRATQSACELGSCIVWSQDAVLLIVSYGNSTFKGPMEQWGPGIARWINDLIRQGNTDYSELMHWSLSRGLLQPEFEFYTAGYVLFLCCALVQWKIPWTNSIVFQKSSFQYCRVGSELLSGSVSLWELAWSSLFDLFAIQSTSEFRPYILRSQTSVLLLAYGTSPIKNPMEQWDSGISRIFHISSQFCHVPCHLISTAATTELVHNKLLQAAFQLYTMDYAPLHGHVHTQAAKSVLNRSSPSQLDYWLQSCDAGHECFGVSASFSSEVLTIGVCKLMAIICDYSLDRIGPSLQDYLLQPYYAGHICFGGSASFSCEVLSIGKRRLVAISFDNVELLSRVLDVQLLLILARRSTPGDAFSECFLNLVSMVDLSSSVPPAKPPDDIDECILTRYSETVYALRYMLLTVWICDLIIARFRLTDEFHAPWDPSGSNHGSCRYRTLVCLQVVGFSCLRRQYPNCKRLSLQVVSENDSQCFAWAIAWSLHSAWCADGYKLYLWEIAWPCCADGYRIFLWEIAWPMILEHSGIDTKYIHLIHAPTLRSFTEAKATTGIKVDAPTFCCVRCLDHAYYSDEVCADQDYYIDIAHDRLHIGHNYYLVRDACYLNFIKVCLNYDTHHDLGEVVKQHVPWDPGGSTHRLEVKPNFKEGRMLATYTLAWLVRGLLWLGCTGVDLGFTGGLTTYTQGSSTNRLAGIRTASASSLLSPLSLFVFLLPVIA